MNTFGEYFRVTTWGESHGRAIGVVVDGCPAGLRIDEEYIQRELNLRRPGSSSLTTRRKESDKVEILSGVFNGCTTGTPISMMIFNQNVRSSDYELIKNIFRPGHADYTYYMKYGIRDYRGGGRASGRETATRVAAGAIARKILEERGIVTVGYLKQVGEITVDEEITELIPDKNISKERALNLRSMVYSSAVRCPIKSSSKKMERVIKSVSKEGDSIGGIVETHSFGVPPGLGDPIFGKLDALLAFALMSVGSVKGVEIGRGFEFIHLKGSESNDAFVSNGETIETISNNSGGILGGISNGMPIVLRAIIKPTPSISKQQKTIDIAGSKREITIKGRHDPCIAVRAVTVIESMVNLVLVDRLLANSNSKIQSWEDKDG